MEQNYVTVNLCIHPTALYHGTPHKATAITSECCKPPTNIGIVAVVYQIVPSSVQLRPGAKAYSHSYTVQSSDHARNWRRDQCTGVGLSRRRKCLGDAGVLKC